MLGFERFELQDADSATRLRLVIRLRDYGLTLPLLEVCGIIEFDAVGLSVETDLEPWQLGCLRQPEGAPVYDLGAALTGIASSPAGKVILTLAGEPSWGVLVDGVVGVSPESELERRPLPLLWQQDGRLGLAELENCEGKPLLRCNQDDLQRWLGRGQ